ncbi:transmembrane protein 116 isoform X1 [Motacilla alba alba]|uniref:transmembrane protein 116 isoform X1 n=1 Tax=Motacilla alba alba TaxID=1094192 RepID=UPI0018D58361|nr:transmembrane protein 116 isoform X1 [Motacilla alba alba]
MALPAEADRLDGGWQEVYSALQWIQFTMAMLSVVGSSSIIAYAVFQNAVRSPEVRPLFYLSLSDLLLGMCWLAGALLYSSPTSQQDLICYNLQAMGQIFYVASFLYTVNYTWHLYMDLKVKYNQNLFRVPPQVVDYASCVGRIATILSSLIPFLLMVPVFCLGNSSNCYQNFSQKHGCLLMHTEMAEPPSEPQGLSGSVCRAMHFYGVGVFLVSFLISFVAILVILSQARGLYKRFVNSTGFLGDQQWAMIKMVEQRVVFYPVAFFCCWAPDSHRSFPGAPELPGVRLDPARVPVPEARLPPGRGHADAAPALPEEILLQHGPRRPARHRGLLLHPALMPQSPSNSSFQLLLPTPGSPEPGWNCPSGRAPARRAEPGAQWT